MSLMNHSPAAEWIIRNSTDRSDPSCNVIFAATRFGVFRDHSQTPQLSRQLPLSRDQRVDVFVNARRAPGLAALGEFDRPRRTMGRLRPSCATI